MYGKLKTHSEYEILMRWKAAFAGCKANNIDVVEDGLDHDNPIWVRLWPDYWEILTHAYSPAHGDKTEPVCVARGYTAGELSMAVTCLRRGRFLVDLNWE